MDLDLHNPLAIEIRQEMASAYFAACKKMVAALEALKAFDQAAAPASPDQKPSPRRLELLHDAVDRVFVVLVQREALKLSCLDGFFKDYEIPDEVRGRLGLSRKA
jgi:hypothetical protein